MTSSPTPSPQAYAERDIAILRMVGTYHVAVTDAVSQVIGGGSNLGHVVRRLADDGLLQLFSRKLPGGVSYVQLSERGAERIGVPKHRARPLGSSALDSPLALMTWCCLSSARRYRIAVSEAKEVIPDLSISKNQAYCVSTEAGKHVLSRVRLVQGGSREVIQSLTNEISDASGCLRDAFASRQFQHVLLVDSEAQRKSLDAGVIRSGLRDLSCVRVELAATSRTVAQYIRAFKRLNKHS